LFHILKKIEMVQNSTSNNTQKEKFIHSHEQQLKKLNVK